MTRRGLCFAVLTVVLCGVSENVRAAQEMNVAGVYNCEGTNPDGTQYRGQVEIVKDDDTYRVIWLMARGVSSIGIGIIRSGMLAVSYFTSANAGIVIYRIENGVRLVGEWAVMDADGHVYREVLTRIGVQASERDHDEQESVDVASMRSGSSR